MNPLKALWEEHGQAAWLDYIERDLLTGGGLEKLVVEDGVRGVTSNPSIFKAAITGSESYDADIDAFLEAHPGASTENLYEALAITDIQMAADILAPVYTASMGTDGFVSLEVSPHLAHDTAGTEAEAHRLWKAVDRPNLMIKVPATAAGIPAIENLIAAGINVNATLMFSLDDYEATRREWRRWRRSLSAGSTPRWTRPSWRSDPMKRSGSAAAPPSRTRDSPIADSSSSSTIRALPRCPRAEPRSRDRCGPQPAPRTPTISTCCMSKSWSAPKRSTPCPQPPSRLTATTAGPGPGSPSHLTRTRRCWRGSVSSGSTSMR